MCESVGVLSFDLFFVGCEVPLEPLHFSVAIEYQEVGAYAVEEETVVADYHCTSLEIYYRLFKDAHGVYVEVVGWFVEEEEIAAAS